ncbi:MAG: ATP-binding protein, partial [Calothrix sp. SM1_5_4]|nr:ATP-binding protein [Calothrix sp. SM1_5_4]
MTSHTRGGAEAGRKIPSSIVLIGDGGTGKTFLLETMIRYLGLKVYDFSKPQDEEAGAMIIRVQDIVDQDDPAHPEKLSIKKVLAHISNFLSLPNGWRGLILFDDLHKAASTEILKQLMTQIQTLFEAPNGLVKVRPMIATGVLGDIKEIPVRNLMLTVTLNPTKDRKKRERFIDRFDKKDPVLEAVAAITRDNYQLEDSIFSRFGEVIDMSEFPREAKVPSLLNKMREANMQEFSAHPRLVAVTPRTLDTLVNAFPHSNARDFLTPATYSLLSLP